MSDSQKGQNLDLIDTSAAVQNKEQLIAIQIDNLKQGGNQIENIVQEFKKILKNNYNFQTTKVNLNGELYISSVKVLKDIEEANQVLICPTLTLDIINGTIKEAQRSVKRHEHLRQKKKAQVSIVIYPVQDESSLLLFFLMFTYSSLKAKKSDLISYCQIFDGRKFEDRQFSIVKSTFTDLTNNFEREKLIIKDGDCSELLQTFKLAACAVSTIDKVDKNEEPFTDQEAPLNVFYKYTPQNVQMYWEYFLRTEENPSLELNFGDGDWVFLYPSENKQYTNYPITTKIVILYVSKQNNLVEDFLKHEKREKTEDSSVVDCYIAVQLSETSSMFYATLNINKKNKSSKMVIHYKQDAFIKSKLIQPTKEQLEKDGYQFSHQFLEAEHPYACDEVHQPVFVCEKFITMFNQKTSPKNLRDLSIKNILEIRQSHQDIMEKSSTYIGQYGVDDDVDEDITQKLVDYFELLNQKQQRKFLNIANTYITTPSEEEEKLAALRHQLEKLFVKTKDQLTKLRISSTQSLFEYMITQSEPYTLKHVNGLLSDLEDALDVINKDLMVEENEQIQKFRQEANPAMYKYYMQMWNKAEVKRKEEREERNEVDEMRYIFFEDQIYCKPQTGLIDKDKYKIPQKLSDLACMLYQHVKLSFEVNLIPSDENAIIDQELIELLKKIQASKKTINTLADLEAFFNQQYAVTLVDGRTKDISKLSGRAIPYFLVQYQDSYDQYGTSLVTLERAYPIPTDQFEFLLENIEGETSLFQVLDYVLTQFFTKYEQCVYENFIESITKALSDNSPINYIWALINEEITQMITDGIEDAEDQKGIDSHTQILLHRYMIEKAIKLKEDIKATKEKDFSFRFRKDVKEYLKDINMKLNKLQIYEAYQERFKLQLEEQGYIVNQREVQLEIERQLKIMKQKEAEMKALEEELARADEKRKKELQAALKKYEEQKAEMERQAEEMIYRRFYNNIYGTLKDHSERIDEDLFDGCDTMEEIKQKLFDASINGHNLISRIWHDGQQKPQDGDWDKFVKFINRNNNNNQVIREIKSKWSIIFAKPTVRLVAGGIIQVAGNYFSMSTVKNKIMNLINQSEEILIIATEKLLWDISEFKIPAKNIGIEAKNMTIVCDTAVLDTQGIDQPQIPQRRVQDFKEGGVWGGDYPYNNYSQFKHGFDGKAGQSGGNIYIKVFENFENRDNLQLIAHGGDAQSGTNGLPGENGKVGANGKDGKAFCDEKARPKTYYKSTWGKEYRSWDGNSRTYGGDASCGGNAGAGGIGGFPGKLTIIHGDQEIRLAVQKAGKGHDGKDGTEGPGGVPGKDGLNGVQCVEYNPPIGYRDYYEGLYRIDKEESWNGTGYIIKELRNKADQQRYGMNDYSRDQNGVLKNLRGQAANQNRRQQATQKQQVNKSMIDSLFQQQKQALIAGLTQKSVQQVSQQATQQAAQEVSQLQKVNDASQQKNSIAGQKQQAAQKLQQSQNMLQQQKQAMAQNQKQMQQIAEKTQQRTQKMMNLNTQLDMIDVTQQQVQQQIQQEATFKEDKSKIKAEPKKDFQWSFGYSKIALNDEIDKLLTADKSGLEGYLEHFRQQHPENLTVIEKFIEIVDSYVIIRKNLKEDAETHLLVVKSNKILEDGLKNIQHLGIRQLISLFSNQSSEMQKHLAEAKIVKEKEMLENLIYQENITPEYLTECKKYADKIFEQLMLKIQFMDQDEAIEILKQSIAKESNLPSTNLSKVFHFTVGVLSKFLKSDKGISKSSFINIIQEIEKMIELLRSQQGIHHSHSTGQICEFQISSCTIYNHYFNRTFKFENYPLDEKMNLFNFYQTADTLVDVLRVYSNVVREAENQSFYLPHLAGQNGRTFLITFQQNLNRVRLDMDHVTTLKELSNQIEAAFENSEILYQEVTPQIESINIIIEQKWQKWCKAIATFNALLAKVGKQQELAQNVYQCAIEALYALENASFNIIKKQIYTNEIEEVLQTSISDPASEIKLKGIAEEIEKKQLIEIQKRQSRQKWSIIKQNLIKIGKRLIFDNDSHAPTQLTFAAGDLPIDQVEAKSKDDFRAWVCDDGYASESQQIKDRLERLLQKFYSQDVVDIIQEKLLRQILVKIVSRKSKQSDTIKNLYFDILDKWADQNNFQSISYSDFSDVFSQSQCPQLPNYLLIQFFNGSIHDKLVDYFSGHEKNAKKFTEGKLYIHNFIRTIFATLKLQEGVKDCEESIMRNPKLANMQQKVLDELYSVVNFTYKTYFELNSQERFNNISKACFETFKQSYDSEQTKMKVISKIFGIQKVPQASQATGSAEKQASDFVTKLEKILKQSPECATYLIKHLNFEPLKLYDSIKKVIFAESSMRVSEGVELIKYRDIAIEEFNVAIIDKFEGEICKLIQNMEDNMIEFDQELKYKILTQIAMIRRYSGYIYDGYGIKNSLNELLNELYQETLNNKLAQGFEDSVKKLLQIKVELMTEESEQLYGTSDRNKVKKQIVKQAKFFNQLQTGQIDESQDVETLNELKKLTPKESTANLLQSIFELLKVEDKQKELRMHDQEQMRHVFISCVMSMNFVQYEDSAIIGLMNNCIEFNRNFGHQQKWKHQLVKWFWSELQYFLSQREVTKYYSHIINYVDATYDTDSLIQGVLEIAASLSFDNDSALRSQFIDRMKMNIQLMIVSSHLSGDITQTKASLQELKVELEKIKCSITDQNKKEKTNEFDSLVFKTTSAQIEKYFNENNIALSGFFSEIQKIVNLITKSDDKAKLIEQNDVKIEEFIKMLPFASFSLQAIQKLKETQLLLDKIQYSVNSQIIVEFNQALKTQIQADKSESVVQIEAGFLSKSQIQNKYSEILKLLSTLVGKIFESQNDEQTKRLQNLIYSSKFISIYTLEFCKDILENFDKPIRPIIDIKQINFDQATYQVIQFVQKVEKFTETKLQLFKACLVDIKDFCLLVGGSQREAQFTRLLQYSIKIIREQDSQTTDDDIQCLLIEKISRSIASSELSKQLDICSDDRVNQQIGENFNHFIRKVRISMKILGKGTQYILDYLGFLSENNLPKQFHSMVLKSLKDCSIVYTDEQKLCYALISIQGGIQKLKIDEQLSFIYNLQTPQNQELMRYLRSVNKNHTTFVKRIWDILTQKDPKTWEEEVFLMTTYYLSSVLIESIDPIDSIKLEEKDYLDERMKQIRNILGAITQQRMDLGGPQNMDLLIGFIQELTNQVTSKKTEKSSQISLKQLEQVILLIEKDDNLDDIKEIFCCFRPKYWHMKLLIRSSEKSISLFVDKKNIDLQIQEAAQIKKTILNNFHLLHQYPSLVETLKSMIDEENTSESESLFLNNQSLIDVSNKLIALKEKGILSQNVIMQLRGGQLNDMQISIQKILIRSQLNYREDNSLHQNIVSSLYAYGTTFGESKLNLLLQIVIEAYKKQKNYDPQDLLILMQKINNKRLVLNDDGFKILKQESDISQWVSLLEQNEKIKQMKDFDLQKQLLSQGKMAEIRYNCNSLCEQIYVDEFNAGVREWVKNRSNGKDPRLTEFILATFKVFYGKSSLYPQSNKICDFTKEQIIAWVKNPGSQKLYQDKDDFEKVGEIFAVVIRGIQLGTGNIARNTQISTSVFFFYEMGHVGQVATGQGKTLITCMWAIIQSIRGLKVDIMSSSSDLASRDQEESAEIYEQFGITVTNNCDSKAAESEEVRKERYQCQVVYGDIGSFQRDYLLDSVFMGAGVRSGRTTGCLMIDEIDSTLLDKGESTLYLSHKIPELASLKNLYVQIWSSVHAKGTTKGSEEDVKTISDCIRLRIETGNIMIPNLIKPIVFRKLKEYVNNAFTAKSMAQNDQYVVNMKKSTGRVVVMDKETGVEQKSTQWSNGLHQFLQLKQQDRLTPESFRAVFISNLKYFHNYRGKIYGLTGTLGATVERNLLNNLYSLKFFNLPRFEQSKYIQCDPIITPSQAAQFNMIKLIVKDVAIQQNRPILFICETVNQALDIENFLFEFYDKVYKRVSADSNLEVGTEENELKGGEVIVATNIAGRGTDLKVHKACSERGGMHVVCTFVPSNIRVEEQAFGRTARKGQQGSGQFCIQFPNSSLTIDDIKLERDRLESYRLSELKKKTIIRLEIEGMLFTKFTQLYVKLVDKLNGDYGIKAVLGKETFSKYVKIQLDLLKNRWAFFLESIADELAEVYKHGKRVIFDLFFKFSSVCSSMVVDQDGLKFAKSYCEMIKLGNFFEEHKQIKLALKCYDRIINEEPNYCEAALYKKAKALMEKDNNCVLEFFGLQNLYNYAIRDEEVNLNKRRSYGILMKRALKLMDQKVTELLAAMQVVKAVDMNYKKRARDVTYENLFEIQIQEIVGLYNYHTSAIKDSIGHLPTVDVLRELYQTYDDTEKFNMINEYFEKNTDLFKLERYSRKVRVTEAPYRFVINGDIHDVPVTLQYCDKEIIQAVKQKLGDKPFKQRLIQEQDFNNAFLTRQQVFDQLKAKGYLSNMKQLIYVGMFDPNKFEALTNISDAEKKELMNVLVECSQQFFEIQDFKGKLKAQSKHYDEIVTKGCATIEEKGMVKFSKTEAENVQRLGERCFALVQGFYEQAVQKETFETEFILSQLNVPLTSTEQFNLLKMLLLTKGIVKQKDFNFKLCNEQKARRAQIKKFIEGITQKIDVTKGEQSSKLLDHFMDLIRQQSEVKIAEQKKKKDEAWIKSFGELVYDAPVEVLEQKRKEFPKTFKKSILDKIGANKTKDAHELKVTKLKAKFADQQKPVPREIDEFYDLGLDEIMNLELGWRFDWRAAAVMLIGVAQVGLGAVLIATGVGAGIGAALISEGISDIIYGATAMAQGEFSWADYAIQKAISVAISVMTMGCASFASAGAQIGKKVGIRAAMSVVKKVVMKQVISMVKEKVIQWTAKTFGVLKMFVENIINKFTTLIVAKGMEIVSMIVEQVLKPVKEYVVAILKKVHSQDVDSFLNKSLECMKETMSQFLGQSEKFIKLFSRAQALLAKIIQKFQKGSQNFSSKMAAILASIPQIIQGCAVVMQIKNQVQKTSKVIENSQKNYNEIERAFVQSNNTEVITQQQAQVKQAQIDEFFAKETVNTMNQIQNQTQKQVDGWVTDMIDKFVNDKVVSAIDTGFDNMLLSVDEDQMSAEQMAALEEEGKQDGELSLLEEAQEGACELLKTCMDGVLNSGIEKLLAKGILVIKDICKPIYTGFRIVLIKICALSYHVKDFVNRLVEMFKTVSGALMNLIRQLGTTIMSYAKHLSTIFDSGLHVTDARKVALWVKNKGMALMKLFDIPTDAEGLTSMVSSFFETIEKKALSIVDKVQSIDLSVPPEFYNKCVEKVDAFLNFFDEWLVTPIMAVLQPVINKLSVYAIKRFQKFFVSLYQKTPSKDTLSKFDAKLNSFITEVQTQNRYEIQWAPVVEKFPVSFDMKNLVEVGRNIDSTADNLINLEDCLQNEYKKAKHNAKNFKNNMQQARADVDKFIQGNGTVREEFKNSVIELAKDQFKEYVPVFVKVQVDNFSEYVLGKIVNVAYSEFQQVKEWIISQVDTKKFFSALHWLKKKVQWVIDAIRDLYFKINEFCVVNFKKIVAMLNINFSLDDPQKFSQLITQKIDQLKKTGNTLIQEALSFGSDISAIFKEIKGSFMGIESGEYLQQDTTQLEMTKEAFLVKVDYFVLSGLQAIKHLVKHIITTNLTHYAEVFVKKFVEICFKLLTSGNAVEKALLGEENEYERVKKSLEAIEATDQLLVQTKQALAPKFDSGLDVMKANLERLQQEFNTASK